MMDRRLRKARGEDVDDNPDGNYDVYDNDFPGGLDRSPSVVYRGSGGGCVQATFYLVLGGLVALLIFIFFFNQTLSGIGNFFQSTTPKLSELVSTPTPIIRSGAAIVQQIRQLNRLETTSYTIERVIEATQPSNVPIVGDWLEGDKLLLIAHGTIVAGIDLSNLAPEDVLISANGKVVTLRLPPVEIFSASLDNTKTRVYDRRQGFFTAANPQLETLARQEGEARILQAACEDGILQQASQDSQRSLAQFLMLLEFETVEVVPAPVPSCVAPDTTDIPAP